MTAPTLTAPELAYYRDMIGDLDVPEVDLDNPAIQQAYDRAYASDDDNADVTEARTMVYLLRRIRGRYRKLHDARGEVETESFGQIWTHLQEELKDWELKAGMTGAIDGGISTGGLYLHLDYTETDLEAEWDS